MYSEYENELKRLQNASGLLKIDAGYMAFLVASAITSFTNLDYLVDLILRSHLDLAKNTGLNTAIKKVLDEKYVDFSEKIPLLEKIATYSGATRFSKGRFIECAGNRNKIVHGYYRILDDENGIPAIFIINKRREGSDELSRPQELYDALKHSVNLCIENLDEIFEKMGLPKYGELSK